MKPDEILVHYGRDPGSMTLRILEESGIAGLIGRDSRVVLKPNLVTAKDAASGATTHPEVAAGVVEFLKSLGVGDITIAEGSWAGGDTRQAFRVCGYDQLARRYGVALLDLKQDGIRKLEAGGLTLEVCRSVLEADFLINLPVLKGHSQTRLTCALKNLKGCIPDAEKRRYHTLGLHRPIALLNTVLKPHLTLVDALCGDLSFEEGGTPVRMDRLILGRDPVLVDSYAATLIGYRPDDIEYVALAAAYGAGSIDLASARMRQLGTPSPMPEPVRQPRSILQFARHIEAKEACSACYGALLHALQRLQERGRLKRLRGMIHVGQGFRGQSLPGMGVGSCASGCSASLPGCPPAARDVLDFLASSSHA
jgi:uncharacterized protein (DUF362 family)